MSMMQTFENISGKVDGKWHIKGEKFRLMEECRNDMYHDRLPTIPAGTDIIADFAGDFGMYGMVEVGGSIHKVKIELHELHKIDFGTFDARNAETSQIAA